MNQRARRVRKYSDIKHSSDGLVAIILGLASLVLVILEVVLTIWKRGQAGGSVGILGIAALLCAIMGIVFAVISWKDEDRIDTFKRIGTGISIIMTLVNLAILIAGIIHRG